MSSGVFTSVTYENDTGDGLPGRCQPETLTAWNPTASVTALAGLGRIKLTAGRREFGLSPRTVSGVWTTAPAGYKAGGTIKVPVFALASYQAITLNDTLAYLGGTFRVTGKNPEKET